MDEDQRGCRDSDSGRKPPTAEETGALHRQTEELLLSETLFQYVFQHASIGIALGLPDGTFARTNPAFDNMMGYKPGELIGMHRSAVTPPEDIAPNEERYRRFRETGEPTLSYEKRYLCKDGRIIWVDVTVSFIRDGDGNAGLSIITSRDISERKQMEQAVHESEEKYRSLLEHAHDAIMIADFEGNLLEVNKRAEELLGYTKEELVGTNISKIHPEEELGRILYTFNQMVQGKTHTLLDTKVLRKDGKLVPVDLSGGTIEYGGKKVAQAICRDIADRKKIEEQLKDYQNHLEKLVDERTKELKESEERYRNMFENAVEGFYQTTPEGRFLKVNPALARMYGYDSPEELVRSVTNIGAEIYVNPERRKEFIAFAEKDGVVRNFETEARRKDGSRKYVSLNARAVRDESGRTLYFEGTVQDVTQQKLTSEQMKAQRDLALMLARTDRLEEGLATILQAAVIVSGMESGGILLKNRETGGFDLVSSIGITKTFQDKIRYAPAEGFVWSVLVERKAFHTRTSRDMTPVASDEGFKSISVLPICEGNEVTGCLVMASKKMIDFPEEVLVGLESLAAGSGNSISRMRARDRLEQEMLVRRETEEALEAERQNLMEANAALKVLLRYREDDNRELEEKFVGNVKHLVLPYVEKLKRGISDPIQRMNIGFIESNLNEIISPFLKSIQSFNLTPRQVQIVSLIREGKTTKDIALLLAMNTQAVDIQRFLIRKKLGLNKSKTNLQTYLKSLI